MTPPVPLMTSLVMLLAMLVLLPMTLMTLVSADDSDRQLDDQFSHFPKAALLRLDSRKTTLPAAAYRFDVTSSGHQRYSDDMRYNTVTGVSLCQCRLRCLADRRCLGFEHDADSDECGLIDILLPPEVAQEEAQGDAWSYGRRRGVSWLGQPCRIDDDCSLFVGDPEASVCDPDSICRCKQGWTEQDEVTCTPDNIFDKLPAETATTGQPREDATDGTAEQSNGTIFGPMVTVAADERSTGEIAGENDAQNTEQNMEQTTEYANGIIPEHVTEAVTQQTSRMLAEGNSTSKQPTTPGIAPLNQSTIEPAIQSTTEQITGQGMLKNITLQKEGTNEPNSHPQNTSLNTGLNGQPQDPSFGDSWMDATERTTESLDRGTSSPATEEAIDPFREYYTAVCDRLLCLTDEVDGKYAAAKCLELGGVQYVPDSEDMVANVIQEFGITSQVGVGMNSKLRQDQILGIDGTELAAGSPWWQRGQPDSRFQNCIALDGDGKLDDVSCGIGGVPMRQLCEYIGPNLLRAAPEPQYRQEHGLWTYDMGEQQRVGSVLFLVGDDTVVLKTTSIFVGADASWEAAVPCATHEGQLAASGFARLLKCGEKRTGRYLHVFTQTEGMTPAPLWMDLAAFSN